MADEEDVALSAFDDFQRGVEQGHFPRLDDRGDLWQVLLLLTRQKAANLLKHERRQKRGSGQVRHLSALAESDSTSSTNGLEELFGSEPTPDFAAQVAEECRRLLDDLDGARLREVAVWKMEGYTNEEIGRKLECSVATVERQVERNTQGVAKGGQLMDSHRPEVKDSLDLAREVDSLCDRFEAAWQGGERPELDAWMPAEGPLRRAALAELARLDREYRLKGGEEKTPEAPVQLPETLAFPSPGGDPQLTRKFLSEQETAPSQEKAAWPLIPGYEVLGVLGQGGMGVVYQARQMGLNRVVALKMILHAEHAGDEERRRFRAEAESIARLQHPNIVQVFEVGEHSGLPFFSLELCAGGSLDQKLNGTPLPPKEAAALVETLARAMDAAHQKGVIHRDLKPANVLLAADGAPKVTDFGLAKKLDEAGQTASGAVMGTPSYMAPEQAGGKTAALGPPCDIYALGAILYECLTGRPPFRGPSVMDTLIQVIADEPVAVRQLQPQMPADVETICLKCLRKEAGRRYESAAALADDLRRWLEGDPIKARRLPWTERAWRWTRRNPALAGVFLLLLTGVVGATAALVNIAEANSKEREARTDAETKGGENLKLAYRLRGSLDDVQTALAGKGAALSAREAEFQKARHNLYVAQLYRVAAIYERNPIEARTLLHDCNNCPIDLRDPIWHLMHNDCRRWEIGILKGHRAGVTSVAWSKDGRTLASGAQDNTVKLWDLTGGQAVRTLKGHTQLVRGVAFSSDGQTLASASWDSTVKLWDLAKDYEIRTLKGHSLAVYAVAFSSDGKHLASASHDKTVRLWDPASGQEQATLVGHTGAVYAVAFSGDGKHLASASHDKTVKLWDVAKQQVVHTFQGHEREVFGVALSSDGRTLASASADTTVRLWDVAARQPRHVLKGHSNWALAVAFSNDGKTLVTSGGGSAGQVVGLGKRPGACPSPGPRSLGHGDGVQQRRQRPRLGQRGPDGAVVRAWFRGRNAPTSRDIPR